MKLVKSLLLGSAAGLIAAAGAQAADLPTRKAAPVDYVRICAVHGPGFFYIPGSDTCIRLSGRARFEYFMGQTVSKGTDPSSFEAFGRFAIDARTQTEWGLLRAYTRVDFYRGTGNDWFGSGSGLRRGTAYSYALHGAGAFPGFAGVDPVQNVAETAVNISAAFVQFGGLTAGRIQSFYDFYADNDTWFGTEDSDVVTNALAYTYTFGSGFSATLSIEDPDERNKFPIAGTGPVASGAINPSTMIGPAYANYALAYPGAGPAGAAGVTALSYARREFVPDVVGVLRVDQGWGSAQLSAMYNRIDTVGATYAPGMTGGLVTSVASGYGAVSGNAFAIQGGVKINLPMLAPGDTLWAQVAYSKGSLASVGSGWTGTYSGTNYSVGGTTFSSYDAVTGPYGGLVLTPAYSAVLALTHYWVPTIRSSLVLGAEHVDYSGSIRTAAGYAAGASCPTCAATVVTGSGALYNPYSPYYDGGTQYTVSGNLVWSPVKDLDIGVEAMYIRNQMQHAEYDVNTGDGRTIKEDDEILGRIRVSRDF